jgi:hypothetical protein
VRRNQAARAVLLVLPTLGLIRAALDVGLETWVMTDTRRPTEPPQDITLPPERLLSADFRDAPAVRALLADTVRRHGIEHRLLDRSCLFPGSSLAPDGLATRSRFHVETVTVGGMHLVVDILPDTLAPPLSETDRAAVREAVRSVLDLLGHASGSARTDVVLTAEGTRVVSSERGTIPPSTVRRSEKGTVRERSR